MTREGIWDVAWDEGDRTTGSEDWSQPGAFAYGAEWAVWWMIAIVNMAEAIRARPVSPVACTICGELTAYPPCCGDCLMSGRAMRPR